jgi:hypothetical protein
MQYLFCISFAFIGLLFWQERKIGIKTTLFFANGSSLLFILAINSKIHSKEL